MQSHKTSYGYRQPEMPGMSKKTKKQIESVFSRHINRGQVKYLKAGHLDVIETERQSISFIDPVSGKEMLDCFSSAGCFNVGRGNPVIKKALEEALGTLDMGNHHLTSPHKIALAKKLIEISPGDLNHVLYASGGGEAIDCAIKLSRAATGRTEIISTEKAYHGHTGFALSANGKEHYRKYFEPLMPGFRFIPFNDPDAVINAVSDKTAAIIVEPVQGEAGIFPADQSYLQLLRQLCDTHGIILIFDEVQTGFGRTGKMFASEHSGVTPDILTLAKSIGGGMFPNGAVLYRGIKQLLDFIKTSPGFHTTYSGGSDIGCFVSLRVIDFLIENKIPESAAENGNVLKQALEEIRKQNTKIVKDVRGIGMMVGIEYIHEFMGPMMSDALARNGVFAAYSGNAPQVMRFMLPLTATKTDINRLIQAVSKAVESMKTLLPLALPAAKIPGVLPVLNNEKVQTVTFNWLRTIEDFVSKLKP